MLVFSRDCILHGTASAKSQSAIDAAFDLRTLSTEHEVGEWLSKSSGARTLPPASWEKETKRKKKENEIISDTKELERERQTFQQCRSRWSNHPLGYTPVAASRDGTQNDWTTIQPLAVCARVSVRKKTHQVSGSSNLFQICNGLSLVHFNLTPPALRC